MMILCNSQRDSLHAASLPRIDNLIGQGLDLAIQAEREAVMSVSHLPDQYNNDDLAVFSCCEVFVGNNEGFPSHSLSTCLIVIPYSEIAELGGFEGSTA